MRLARSIFARIPDMAATAAVVALMAICLGGCRVLWIHAP
jgi:hypothetical protein